MSEVTVDGNEAAPQHAAAPNLGWAVAGLSTGAGVIHFAMVPIHAANGWQDPFAFAAAGWFQLVAAGAILANRASTRLYQAVVAANLAFIGVWIWSRTAGLPWGAHAGVAESVAAVDLACVVLEAGAILVALRILLAPARRTTGMLVPAFAAVAALGLATTVITSPDAANHSHGTTLSAGDAAREKVQAERCDRSFNIPAYWDEATYLGVDTVYGGNDPYAGAASTGATSADGHQHGSGASAAGGTTTTTEPDPTGGAGSPGLDQLVSSTSLAATSEIEAANLVTNLAHASEADYQAWLWWIRKSGLISHSHAATATAQLSGHGGHVGPQPWVALTDPKQCKQLGDELAEAREVAMRFPTAQDAMDAGYNRVTPYLSGIAAHYMKFSYVDGVFDIEEPEMILYDGDGPEAHVVGLSYYLRNPGDQEPTQGFTGDNDHGHRHIGLCSGPNGVIGDSTTTEEECARRGGRKGDGSGSWMIHAWVVPGCESPWGVFSAASPILDNDLLRSSGTDDGHCAGSEVRERYGLDDLGTSSTESASSGAAPGGASAVDAPAAKGD
jgi:hypothetical protein